MSDTLYGIVYGREYPRLAREIHAPFTTLSEVRSAYDPASFGTRAQIVEVVPIGKPEDADWRAVRIVETLRTGPYPLEAIEPDHAGEKTHIVTNQGNHYASTWDPSAARHIVAGPDLFDALKEAVRAAQQGKRMSKANHEAAQTAIDRWEKGTA